MPIRYDPKLGRYVSSTGFVSDAINPSILDRFSNGAGYLSNQIPMEPRGLVNAKGRVVDQIDTTPAMLGGFVNSKGRIVDQIDTTPGNGALINTLSARQSIGLRPRIYPNMTPEETTIGAVPKHMNGVPEATAMQPINSLQRPGYQNNYLPGNGELSTINVRPAYLNETPTVLPGATTTGRVYRNQLNELPSEAVRRANQSANRQQLSGLTLPELPTIDPGTLGTKVGEAITNAPNTLYEAATGKPITDLISPYLKPLKDFGTGVLSGVTEYDLSARPVTVKAAKSTSTNAFNTNIAPEKTSTNAFNTNIAPEKTSTNAFNTNIAPEKTSTAATQVSAEAPISTNAVARVSGNTGTSNSGSSGASNAGSVSNYLKTMASNRNALTQAGAIPVIRGNSTYYDIPLDNGGGSFHASFTEPGSVQGAVLLNEAGGHPSIAKQLIAKEAALGAANINANASAIRSGALIDAAVKRAKPKSTEATVLEQHAQDLYLNQQLQQQLAASTNPEEKKQIQDDLTKTAYSLNMGSDYLKTLANEKLRMGLLK